jgi:hypothetical protein
LGLIAKRWAIGRCGYGFGYGFSSGVSGSASLQSRNSPYVVMDADQGIGLLRHVAARDGKRGPAAVELGLSGFGITARLGGAALRR